jgi:NAD(P)-dependent dehydrogenase (short-subunit alcohol dehydrogenase family)
MKPEHGILAGKSAVVAGSSRGIGRAVASALAREGARVVVNGRSEEPVREEVERIREAGGEARAFVGSAGDFDTAADMIACCVESFGAIDILVNCVGIAEPPGSSILDLSADAWRALIDSHLTSTFNTCRHAAPYMKSQGQGSIVNTSSHAFLGSYGGTGYPAGKGGVNSLTFAMAAELREDGVRVNAVCPGARTRLSTGDAYEAHIRALHERGLLSEVARDASLDPPDPDHLGPLYAFLASDRAHAISGRIFSGAGGYVGLFAEQIETLLVYRDHQGEGRWDVEALADAILAADPLKNA